MAGGPRRGFSAVANGLVNLNNRNEKSSRINGRKPCRSVYRMQLSLVPKRTRLGEELVGQFRHLRPVVGVPDHDHVARGASRLLQRSAQRS
jgi:hypothetical protein